jgi:hypothetical protein
MNRKTLSSILSLCLLCAAVYLTIVLISPPAPLPAEAPATEFSAGRAMQDLDIIAREPHPVGVSLAHEKVRDYLVGEIRLLGPEPQVQAAVGTRVVQPGTRISESVENILVCLPGVKPGGAILLMAHYDSAPENPGALDDGTGTAMLLEILRALRVGTALRQDVIFLFTDGEEPGVLGASAFIAEHPWFNKVQLAINLETFIDGPPAILTISSEDGAWIQAFARSIEKPVLVSLPFHLFGASTTDAIPFLEAGIPAVDIEAPSYPAETHTPSDRLQVVKPSVVQHAGSQVLALVRTLGNQPTLAMRAPDETFFPVLGRLVHYSNTLVIPFASAATLCYLGTIIYGFRKKALSWHGLAVGFFAVLIDLTLSVGIATLSWRGILALHPEYESTLLRVYVNDSILYALGLLVLALAVAASTVAVARRKVAALDLAAGSLVI